MSNKSEWVGALGAKWAAQTSKVEKLLGPFGEDAIAALGDVAGKRVLDLGCGGGMTSFALARRGAQVIGVDVSPDLVALAEKRRGAESGPAREVIFRCEDAAEARFDAPLDGLYSQFGAMFFDEPLKAYKNLRAAMKPGAPLAIAAWRTPRENEWASLPLRAAKAVLPPTPPADRRAPGPFSWSEPEESFAPLLAEAGWSDVKWVENDHLISLTAEEPGAPVDAAMAFVKQVGPLASRLKDMPADLQTKALDAVREVLAAREEAGDIKVAGAGWVVTARA